MNEWTEIICILDRSGSMSGLESDTMGGFNAFVKRQREEQGRARLTLVLFDDQYEVPLEHVDIQNVPVLTERLYYVRGSTALLDAIGRTVSKVRRRIAASHATERPAHVVVMVFTDGYENCSREYTPHQVKQLITATQKEGWEYVFLGADIDAFHSSDALAMQQGSASRVAKSSRGVQEAYAKVNRAVSNLRRGRAKGDVDSPLSEDDLL